MSFAVKTQDLSKSFGTTLAVDALTLDVEIGSIVGLIGPNGAGKTTALRMLLDVIRPSSGKARVLGVSPQHGGPALRRRIGFIPGELRLEAAVNGRKLLSFFEEISGPVRPGAIDGLAERFQVDLGRPVRTLSKGNRQKIGLIQAFMHEPELLILDEPTSGLDPLMQREFLDLITECRDRGQTVLLSSHVLSEIQQTADAVWVMSKGAVVAHGAVSELRLAALRTLRARLTGPGLAALRGALEAMSEVSQLRWSEAESGSALVEMKVTGRIDSIVKALAGVIVEEITIVEPDLEESVLELYGNHRSSDG